MDEQRWEYRLVPAADFPSPDKLQAEYNRLGAEGWELVAHVGYALLDHAVFKRPAREA